MSILQNTLPTVQIIDFHHEDGRTERFHVSTPQEKDTAAVSILKKLLLNGFIPTPGDPIRSGVVTCDDRVKGCHQLTPSFVNATRILNNKPVLEVVMKRNEDYTLEAWRTVMNDSGFREDDEYVVDDDSVSVVLTPFEVLEAVPNAGKFVTIYEEGYRPGLRLVG